MKSASTGKSCGEISHVRERERNNKAKGRTEQGILKTKHKEGPS